MSEDELTHNKDSVDDLFHIFMVTYEINLQNTTPSAKETRWKINSEKQNISLIVGEV
jgi:hypothetical protein